MKRINTVLSGSCFIVLLILLVPLQDSAAESVVLANNVSEFTVLNDTEVLYCDSDVNFFIVSTQPPYETRSWDPGWDPTDSGWEYAGTLRYLFASPDGEWVCFARFVLIPENVLLPDEYVHSPYAVVIAPVHGTTAWLAALAQEVGGGPNFDFTMDSMNLYGQPFVSSETTLEGYLADCRGDPDREIVEAFSVINLLSGERTGGGLPLNDGFLACPYSDLVAVNDYSLEMIVDMSLEKIVLRNNSGQYRFEVEKWVSEDAILLDDDGEQCLLYADGTVVFNPGENNITVYCCMPDGKYVFSTDGGSTMLYGSIDWESFSPDSAVPMSVIGDNLSTWDKILPMADGSGIVFFSHQLNGLLFHPCP
ncbi:MAG: hypothetical protein KAR44_07975 [Candidatus Aegiribacteria sp.]|nr:hypothetical protein [Candidatus Aegiribacteria sp.]